MGDGSGYQVVYESASAAADTTSTKVEALDGVQTSITQAISAAEGALPTEFATAAARLKILRETHVDDVKDIQTYAAGAVSSLKECLKTYENTSAEMVAETYKLENNVAFDHSTILGQSENTINDKIGEKTGLKDINDGLPGRDEGRSGEGSYSSTTARDGSSETTESTRSSTRGGSTTTSSDTYEYGTSNGVTTSESTRTATHTSGGATDTTTYYNGTSFQGDGHDEATVSGRSYTVEGGGQSSTTTEGQMKVPVAP